LPSVKSSVYKSSMKLGKRPDTGAYYIRIDGKRISLKKFVGHAVTDGNQAKKIFNQVKREVLAGKLIQLGGGSSITLGQFKEEFLEWSESTRPHSTFRADRLGLDKLAEVAGETITLDRLTLKHLDKIKTFKLKPKSINTHISHIRAAFNKAVDWEYLKSNPFSNAKGLPNEKKPPLYIEPKDVTKFIASIQDVDKRRLVTAFIYTGRRRGELVALCWENIDWEREEYFIERSKVHLSKWYPIHPIFKSVLKAIGPKEKGHVFTRWRHPDTVTHRIKEALKGYGLGHLSLHKLRHTFATLLVTEGVDLNTIGDLLGHTDKRAAEIYSHVTETRARSALKKIKAGPIEL